MKKQLTKAMEFAYKEIGTLWNENAKAEKLSIDDYVERECSELSRIAPLASVYLISKPSEATVYLLEKSEKSGPILESLNEREKEFLIQEIDTQKFILEAILFCNKHNLLTNEQS